jgi:hypothetical protein
MTGTGGDCAVSDGVGEAAAGAVDDRAGPARWVADGPDAPDGGPLCAGPWICMTVTTAAAPVAAATTAISATTPIHQGWYERARPARIMTEVKQHGK